MDKSINDIRAQAERVIVLAKGSNRFPCAKRGEVDRVAVYQLRSASLQQHGFSMFDKDRDTKKPRVHQINIRRKSMQHLWWQDIDLTKRKREVQQEKPGKELSSSERINYQVALNNLCNHGMKVKVLAWVNQDILLKTELGLEGDPMEIPKWLHNEMSMILDKAR